MKKFLLMLLFVLSGTMLWAQDWQAPSETEYPNSTVVYVQTNVNGVENTDLQVAAFIDDECRAAVRGAGVATANGNLYALRVWGGNADMNKEITFKAYNVMSGLTYSFTKTAMFTGETNTEIPFVLNIDEPTGLSIDPRIELIQKLPFEYDMKQHYRFTYDDPASGSSYTPLGESVIETLLIHEWSNPMPEIFNIDGDDRLYAYQATEEGMSSEVSLSLLLPTGAPLFQAITSIIIAEPHVYVDAITCSLTNVKMSKGESLYDNVELANSITVTPDDATNKQYKFVGDDSEAEVAFMDGVAQKGGTYAVRIVSLENESIYTTITVEVYAPVISIRLSETTFHAKLNDNIEELIAPYVNVIPEDATDLTYTIDTSNAPGIVNGVAVKPGQYTVYVVANDNKEIKAEATVIITEIYAPSKIEVNIGDNVYDILQSQIYVEPQIEPGYFEFEITPADDASAEAIVDGVATKTGEYRVIVTSTTNREVTKEVVVYVILPVQITFPATLTLSKLADVELQLTFVEGDNFDPALVQIEFINESNPMDNQWGVPTFYATDAQNLTYNVRAVLCGSYNLRVRYDGEYMYNEEGSDYTIVEVPVEATFNSNGWDWISVGAEIMLQREGNYLANMNVDANNRIIEIRSQRALLYNDPVLGIFGDIYDLSPKMGMYKIKAQYDNAEYCHFTSTQVYYNRGSFIPTEIGYTWIAYDNEWNMTVDDLSYTMSPNVFNEGDQIIGKDGFAEYTEGAWVASDGFYLQAGKGYLYYNASDAPNNISFDYTPYDLSMNMAPRRAKDTGCIWQYDASQYADNMAIVAEVVDIDCPEDYVVGAFVDGECRGVGRAASNGKMMISVAGKAGETVTFTLYNEYTGEFTEIREAAVYGSKLGSFSTPAVFSTGIATSLDNTLNSENQEVVYYDLNGRRVDADVATQGVYIVKITNGENTVTKKVVKKQ